MGSRMRCERMALFLHTKFQSLLVAALRWEKQEAKNSLRPGPPPLLRRGGGKEAEPLLIPPTSCGPCPCTPLEKEWGLQGRGPVMPPRIRLSHLHLSGTMGPSCKKGMLFFSRIYQMSMVIYILPPRRTAFRGKYIFLCEEARESEQGGPTISPWL